MGSANKPPFYQNFLEASEDKAAKSAILLDLPEHTLNVGLALAVPCLSFFTFQSFTSLLFLFVIDRIPLHGTSIFGSCAGRTERTPFAFVALVVLDDRSISRFCGLLRSSCTNQFFPVRTNPNVLFFLVCPVLWMVRVLLDFACVLFLIRVVLDKCGNVFSSSFT